MQILKPLVVYIPDTRGVTLSQYGLGNLKIGPGVFTYSRLPGRPFKTALGTSDAHPLAIDETPRIHSRPSTGWAGTCPGSTPECEHVCYAERPVREMGSVAAMWLRNSISSKVPPIPDECRILRLHISGDFDTVRYIDNWIERLNERPDVTCWAYTRSWRVAGLLPALERLRALPNMQLLASMDKSHPDVPPTGWRRAWIDGDPRAGAPIEVLAHDYDTSVKANSNTFDGDFSFVCPEETGKKANCVECGYCQHGRKHDVTFLLH